MSQKQQNKQPDPLPLDQDPSIKRRDARLAARMEALQGLPPSEAAAKAVQLAAAAAHRKQLELEKGSKVTRRERAQMLREMRAGIQAAANVGQRVRTGQEVPEQMMQAARTQLPTLVAELVAAVPYNATAAQAAAESVGEEAVEAVRQEVEKLAAALPPVATAPAMAQNAIGEAVREGKEAGEAVSTPATIEAPSACSGGEAVSKIGRPSTYTPEKAQSICEWIQAGKSLNRYCIEHGMQPGTVYKWLMERVEFAQNYARAHENRADTLVEDMLDIADRAERATDMTQVIAAKLQIDTRKWIAERMRPEKYGTKVQVEQKGQVTFSLGVPKRQNAEVIDVESTPSLRNEGASGTT